MKLAGKEWYGTLEDWELRDGDLHGRYKPTPQKVVYRREYIQRIMLEERIVILKDIDGYLRLGNAKIENLVVNSI